tara:strand:- start:1516 stop:1626 length:111 start_codon:yes stop_codon:yes gene_type:complete
MSESNNIISIALLVGKIVVLALLATTGDSSFIYQNF